MKEVLTRANSTEFKARYYGTYGFLKAPSGKKLAVLITESGSSYTMCRDMDGNSYRLNNDTGCELEFTQVPNGWHTIHPGKVVYIYRLPERQWKRGISPENTGIKTFDNKGNLYQIDFEPEIIQQIFYPTEMEYEPTGIECGTYGKFFAWGINKIYVKDIEIGTVDHKTASIKLSLPIIEQELKDALARTRTMYEIRAA